MWGYSGLSLEFPVSVPAWAAEPLSSQSCLSLEDFSPKFSQQCECLSRNKPKGTVSANTPNAAREVSSTLVNVCFQSQPAAPSCEPALRPCDSGAACRAPFPSSSFLPASQGVGVRHRAGGFSGKTVGLTPELFPQHTGLGVPSGEPAAQAPATWSCCGGFWKEPSRSWRVNEPTQGTAVVGVFPRCEQENGDDPASLKGGILAQAKLKMVRLTRSHAPTRATTPRS